MQVQPTPSTHRFTGNSQPAIAASSTCLRWRLQIHRDLYQTWGVRPSFEFVDLMGLSQGLGGMP